MAGKKGFTVTQPKILIWLSLIIIGFFGIMIALEGIASAEGLLVKMILTAGFVFVPCGLIILWALTFRIRVKGTAISVCRCFGLVRYSFDAAEIARVCCKTVQTKAGQNQKFTVYTTAGKKFPVETLMVNSGKMIQFLEKHVDTDKFQHSFKRFR